MNWLNTEVVCLDFICTTHENDLDSANIKLRDKLDLGDNIVIEIIGVGFSRKLTYPTEVFRIVLLNYPGYASKKEGISPDSVAKIYSSWEPNGPLNFGLSETHLITSKEFRDNTIYEDLDDMNFRNINGSLFFKYNREFDPTLRFEGKFTSEVENKVAEGCFLVKLYDLTYENVLPDYIDKGLLDKRSSFGPNLIQGLHEG